MTISNTTARPLAGAVVARGPPIIVIRGCTRAASNDPRSLGGQTGIMTTQCRPRNVLMTQRSSFFAFFIFKKEKKYIFCLLNIFFK